MSQALAHEKAALGAVTLDRVDPGWFRYMVSPHMGLDEFDMESGDDCVVGRRFDSWGNRWMMAELLDPENRAVYAEGQRLSDQYDGWTSEQQETYYAAHVKARTVLDHYGFYITDHLDAEFTYGELTIAWRNEIRSRLHVTALA